jgi:hypothetical protein
MQKHTAVALSQQSFLYKPFGTSGRLTPQPCELGPMATLTPSGQQPHTTSKQETFQREWFVVLLLERATFLPVFLGLFTSFSGQPFFLGSGDGVLPSEQQPYSPQRGSNEDKDLETTKKNNDYLNTPCIHKATCDTTGLTFLHEEKTNVPFLQSGFSPP